MALRLVRSRFRPTKDLTLLLPITTLSLVCCLIITRRSDVPRSSLFLALSFWAGGVLLMSLPILDFKVTYSVVTDAFVASSLIAVTCSYMWFRRPFQPIPKLSWSHQREKFLTLVLSLLGIAGCVLLLVDARSRGTALNAGHLFNNLATIRASAFDTLYDKVARPSAATILGSYLAGCSFLSVIAAVRLRRSAGKAVLLLGMLNFVLFGAVGLFNYGGRSQIVYVAIVVLLAGYICGWEMSFLKPKSIFIGSAAFVVVWFFSISWLAQRETDSAKPESVLLSVEHAVIHPWVAELVGKEEERQFALVSLGYFSSPLPTLTYYLQQDVPGPFFGAYTYPLPARVLAKIRGVPMEHSWIEVRRQIFHPLEAAGYQGNVWPTWLRDLVVDFGYVGAIGFCAGFGAFMAWACNRFERTGGLHYLFFDVLATFTFAFGAFQNVLWFNFFSNAFFIAILVMVGLRIRISVTDRPPGCQLQPSPGACADGVTA